MQWIQGTSVATTVARVAAAAQIHSLAWELPYNAGAAIKKREREQFLGLCLGGSDSGVWIRLLSLFNEVPGMSISRATWKTGIGFIEALGSPRYGKSRDF